MMYIVNWPWGWNEDPHIRYIDGLCFVCVTAPNNKPDGLFVEDFHLDDLIQYIQEKELKKACLSEMTNFNFLKQCPSLQYLRIEYKLPFHKWDETKKRGNYLYPVYDMEPLYTLPHLKYLSCWDAEDYDGCVKTKVKIDLSRLNELEMAVGEAELFANLDKAYSLKTINFKHYKKKDLQELSNLINLDSFNFELSSLRSLDGIEKIQKMKRVSLKYNRSLEDISALKNVRNTLQRLHIEKCPKIKDFSVLQELENLEFLWVTGTNVLPNLDFIKSMKNLKMLGIQCDVLDGDLRPALDVAHVIVQPDRRHYNLKNKDLPKNDYEIDTGIEDWRGGY